MSEVDEPQNKASLKVDDPKAIYKLSSFILISEDAEDCNDSAIKLLKKQLRRVAGTATSGRLDAHYSCWWYVSWSSQGRDLPVSCLAI